MEYLDTGQFERIQAGGTTFSTGPLGLASSTDAAVLSTNYVRDSYGGLVARKDLLGTQYYLFDRLGSVVALTDAQGNAVNTYVYDPYGNHLSGTTEAVANPWQYAGGFKDSFSGYYKFGTRYYDPTIGRWTQPDPSGMEANSYAYAVGNPVNFVDPTGQFSCENNRFCRSAKSVGKGAWKGAKKAASVAGRCVVDAGTCSTNMTVAIFPLVPMTTGATLFVMGAGLCAGSGGAACFAGANLMLSGAGGVGSGAVLARKCWLSDERAECYQPLLREQ